MFDLIPLEYYYPVYYNMLLIIVICVFFHTQKYAGSEIRVSSYNRTAALFLLTLITLYIGLRPISGAYFGDMGTYAHDYNNYAKGASLIYDDIAFNIYMKSCASIMSANAWFLLSTFIYVGCLYWACKRMFPDYVFIALLMCITAFSFIGYAVNGIRNGLATSIFILGISFYNKKSVGIPLCLLAIGIHKAMLLPFGALVLAWFYSNTGVYILVWCVCIIFSNILGGFWENFFSHSGLVDDERFSDYLTTTKYADQFSSTGFRWDFLLYSAVPVALGYYTSIYKKFKDKFYLLFLNTYIIANAFWILVIRASFSNRFAYLSWCLYPIVLIYPAIKFDLWKRPYAKTGIIICLHFAFTYIMWLRGR